MDYDIVVIGAGHAGIEASLASARMGCPTLLVTMDTATIGLMSCNPAIGGVGKGQLVKEIDALGGQMARATDTCGIQFRILNASKGPAVQSSRAQVDTALYNQYMRGAVKNQSNLTLKEAQITGLIIQDSQIRGVITDKKEKISAACVILCPGTFLEGLIHIGLKHSSGGRINEPAACQLAGNLKALGFRLLRFKTGTCPRIAKDSIDFSRLIVQEGDCPAKPFSFSTPEIKQKQVPCHITHTNKTTHQIILGNLDRSPLYAGIIKSTGVRYCPSIEDKVVRFKDKEKHQVFLEPEGYEAERVYPNGLSTSLPEDVQLEFLRSIRGLEEAEVIRFGYGIEHSVVEPTQLYPTLETKLISNLYFAGQINGTTGYEEAAAQGLIAGINAGLRAKNKEPLVLDRSLSYIGVLIDDLTTKGTNEPYRMFTSRVEYRLILREDNAELRLRKIGYELGLVDEDSHRRTGEEIKEIQEGLRFLRTTRVNPGREINKTLPGLKSAPIKKSVTLEGLLKRPEINWSNLKELGSFTLDISESASYQIEIEVKYSGFIQRQLKEVEKFRNLEGIRLPGDTEYINIPGLSREIKEKLTRIKPFNLGQASRISGITPAAISILMVYLRKKNAQR